MSGFAQVAAAIATPFRDDLSVDEPALVRHAQWLLGSGCDGLVLFGTTGESASLTIAERRRILETLLAAGIPADALVVGTGCCAIGDSVELTRHAGGLGVAGALLLPPFFFRGTGDAGVEAWYDRLIAACGSGIPPVYLYNIPRITEAPLAAGLVARLVARHGDVIRGYKDSSGDWANTAAILERCPGLAMFVGSEAMLLDVLSHGGRGCISATANLQPGRIRALVDNWQSDDAAALQAEIAGCRAAIEGRGPLIPGVKAALSIVHGDPGWCRIRPPLLPLEGARYADLDFGALVPAWSSKP